MTKWLPTVLITMTLAAPAAANDTTAVLEAGGLVYTHQGDISMQREDLFISPSQVRVDYVFENAAATDIDTVVAFPMPDIGGQLDFMGDAGDVESANFMGFAVTQDGQAITPNLQQRAYVNGIDVTDIIVGQGVSLLPLSQAASRALVQLPLQVRQDWITRGLILDMAYSPDGKPVEPELYPIWKLKTVYWWKTVFPAGKQVKVHHSYRPSVGGTVAMTFIRDGKPSDYFSEYKDRYCIDDDFMRTAAKLEKLQDYEKGIVFTEKWLSYILTTAANWNGPIGSFHLTVDKGDPKNYVSFCGKDVRKTGPTTFEMNATDFYPEKDLHLLLVGPGG
ncbi:MAG: DUF4424 domain-containing protein [Allorhizobium sp.]